MSWLTPKLNERVQILIPRQKENVDNGSLDLFFGEPIGQEFEFGSFENLAPVKTVWMEIKPVSFQGRGSQYIRGEQINENSTHKFKCRINSVNDLGREFSSAFSSAFKYMPDLMGLKSNYFLFLEQGSSVKGRLFRIHDVVQNREEKEYFNIGGEEIESRGDGYGT